MIIRALVQGARGQEVTLRTSLPQHPLLYVHFFDRMQPNWGHGLLSLRCLLSGLFLLADFSYLLHYPAAEKLELDTAT